MHHHASYRICMAPGVDFKWKQVERNQRKLKIQAVPGAAGLGSCALEAPRLRFGTPLDRSDSVGSPGHSHVPWGAMGSHDVPWPS